MQTRGRVVHAVFDSCRRMNDFTGPLALRLDRTLLFFCSAAEALGGGGFLQWIPIDFSGGVIELHAAPIATTVSSSLAPPRSAPPPPPPPTHC